MICYTPAIQKPQDEKAMGTNYLCPLFSGNKCIHCAHRYKALRNFLSIICPLSLQIRSHIIKSNASARKLSQTKRPQYLIHEHSVICQTEIATLITRISLVQIQLPQPSVFTSVEASSIGAIFMCTAMAADIKRKHDVLLASATSLKSRRWLR